MPQILTALLPFLTVFLTGYLSHDGFPRWANSGIAIGVLAIAAASWALLGGQLVPDPVADFVLIAGYCAALEAGPLAPLMQWITLNWMSPFAILAPPRPPAPPASPASVRPRASMLPQGRTWAIDVHDEGPVLAGGVTWTPEDALAQTTRPVPQASPESGVTQPPQGSDPYSDAGQRDAS